MPRKHVIISGRVQGVGFRYHTYLLAGAFRLTGWMRNLNSGDVELEAQGSLQSLEQFLIQLEKRYGFARVDHMEIRDIDEIQESKFKIED